MDLTSPLLPQLLPQPLPQPGLASNRNRRFLTRRLRGAANEPPDFHHGLFTTMRQSVLAHSGDALESRQVWSPVNGAAGPAGTGRN